MTSRCAPRRAWRRRRAGQHVPVRRSARSRGRPGTRSSAPCTAGRWTARCTWSASAASVRAARRQGRRRPSSSTAGDVVVIASGQPRRWSTSPPSRPDDAGADGRGVPGPGRRAGGAPGRRVRRRCAPTPRGLVVCGRGGTRYLEEDRVEGSDPLAAFGPLGGRGRSSGTPGWPTSATWSSTARWTRAPTRSAPTRSWSATTAASAAGRPRPCWCTRRRGRWTTAPLAGADAVHRQLVRWLRLRRPARLDRRPAVCRDAAGCGRARPAHRSAQQSSAVREA